MSPQDVVWVSLMARPSNGGAMKYHETRQCYARQQGYKRIPTFRRAAEDAGLEPCGKCRG